MTMTIKELKELIKDYPDDLLVMTLDEDGDPRHIADVWTDNRLYDELYSTSYYSACIIN